MSIVTICGHLLTVLHGKMFPVTHLLSLRNKKQSVSILLLNKKLFTVNALKFQDTFQFLIINEMLVIRTGIHKMLVRISD